MSLTSSVTAQQASGGFAPDRPGAIRIDTVSHRYGHGRESVTALGPVSIDVTPGEFLVLVGASGCGKSTLLRLIAGFESPSSGTVQVSGSDPIPGQTVVRLAQRGELPAIKLARRWRFSTAALEALFRPGQSPKENQGESSS